MLNHGKHVLCEKPLCMNEKQVKKLIQHAESKNLFLMEAIWSRFFPMYRYLEELLKTNDLGEIHEVNMTFGFEISTHKKLHGGAILDLGVYPIQFSQFIFKEPPTKIIATGLLNDEGSDLEVEGKLFYSGKRVTQFKISSIRCYENSAIIKGTNGEITIPNFWCPTSIIGLNGIERRMEFFKDPIGKYNFQNSEGLRFQAQAARECIRNGLIESSKMSHSDSLIISQIEDEIRKQINVKYPEDEINY